MWSGNGTLPADYGCACASKPVFSAPSFDGWGAAHRKTDDAACERFKQLRTDALKKMRHAPLFSRERHQFEMLAKEYGARYYACHMRVKRHGAPLAPPPKLKPSRPDEKLLPPSAGTGPGPIPDLPAAAGGGPSLLLVGGAAALGLLAIFALSRPSPSSGGTSFTVRRATVPARRPHVAR